MESTDSHRSVVIRDALLFTPDGRRRGDCLVQQGRIAALGDIEASAGRRADRHIDAAGRWLWPGVIDGHVHFRDPGATHKEDWQSGSAAAVAGGVTSVLDMPNTSPPTTTIERLAQKRDRAADQSHCNFGLFFGAQTTNHAQLHRALAPAGGPVAGLKIFMGCSTGDLLVYREKDLDEIFAAWLQTICVHAESERRLRERADQFRGRDDPAVHSEIRDPQCAADAVGLACRLAIDHGRDLHVLHVSTRAELTEIKRARQQIDAHGLASTITCEVCPHHLFLNTDAYDTLGTRAQMNPPLRPEADRLAMWQALADGHIDMIATDHAPHTLAEKDRPYRQAPSGVPGVETLLALMLDAAKRGLCRPEDVLQWICRAPARIWAIARRGRIEPGMWADLVLIDPDMTRTVRDADQFSKCGWSPWAGRPLTGWPVLTMVGGHVVYRREDAGRGRVVGPPGAGRQLNGKRFK